MNRSENINELAAALAKAQGTMEAAKKSVQNTFYKSSYADLAAIVAAARAPLANAGLAVTQTTEFADGQSWIETVLMHSSGQWIASRYPVRPVKDDPQGFGSALTYARRYAFAAIVGVVAEDEDDDGNAASNTNGTHPIERQARDAAASNPKADPSLALKQWITEAERSIKACSTGAELSAWEDKSKNALVKLHGLDARAHKKMMDMLQERHVTLSPLAA